MYFILLFLLFCWKLDYVLNDNNQDAPLSFTELAKKYGHNCEDFDVITKDGYILKLFHIKGDKTKIILLAHGITDSADSFIIRGNLSLAITLANKGYDVWALNVRGTKYSRRHVTLSPDNKKFWDYSFHEMGTKDLPANIDFVLNKTNQSKLTIIGFSQGTQMSFVMSSMLSEYNAKLNGIIALAPVAYLHNVKFPLSILIPLLLPISSVQKVTDNEEIFKNGSLQTNTIQKVCTQKNVGYEICGLGVIFPLLGSDPSELEPDFFPILFEHFPISTSRKNLEHCAQVMTRKKFAQFDYGLANLMIYGSLEPPEYPLANINVPVGLLVGLNDKIADVTDVKILRDRLPNPHYHEIKRKQCNHPDLVYGRTMDEYLYPILFELLHNFTKS
ncbi:unnamed protein product [Diatraea saccharalis]|uniref:Lipase n=1 Tax=Diatraea saccharalis TaxID=40085 RepID=A0A9N9RB33_9NEOP|nr:unnamed protein product [Diatraea saccharalis]